MTLLTIANYSVAVINIGGLRGQNCTTYIFCRLDTIPSANLRQQKLEQQRLRIEQKQKQKREAGKLIQASDLKSASSVKRGARPLSGRRELHGYEGPLQFLQGNNPDEMTTVQVNNSTHIRFPLGHQIKYFIVKSKKCCYAKVIIEGLTIASHALPSYFSIILLAFSSGFLD